MRSLSLSLCRVDWIGGNKKAKEKREKNRTKKEEEEELEPVLHSWAELPVIAPGRRGWKKRKKEGGSRTTV